MATEQGGIIIKDKDGNWYVLTQAILERARVPQNLTGELEQTLSGDVTGHVFGEDPNPPVVSFQFIPNLANLTGLTTFVNQQLQFSAGTGSAETGSASQMNIQTSSAPRPQ